MILTIDQIKEITKGAVRVEKHNGKICLYRFTEAQEAAFYAYSPANFYRKTFATAGIRLEFITDSKRLSMTVDVRCKFSSTRQFFAHSVYANGQLVGRIERKQNEKTPDGEFSGEFELGEGEKRVCIYFPWSGVSKICSIELDDGAKIVPVEKKCKMIMFGDSITHGYDAEYPENSYGSIITDALDAETVNKGISGDVFFPKLGLLCDNFEPDYITVAYGTNDWFFSDKATFDRDCEAFYTSISANYANSTIFALSPIWRGDENEKTKVGEFSYAAKKIAAVADKLPNVIFINGYDFVPHDPEYFSDKFLHPNDEGFKHYAENLLREIKQYIE